MGKKAGAKSPATKLDKAIAQARAEVERRKKQLAEANRALARVEARRSPSETAAQKPAGTSPAAPSPVVAKKAPATRRPAARKPAAAKPGSTSPRRPTRTTRSAPGSSKTP